MMNRALHLPLAALLCAGIALANCKSSEEQQPPPAENDGGNNLAAGNQATGPSSSDSGSTTAAGNKAAAPAVVTQLNNTLAALPPFKFNACKFRKGPKKTKKWMEENASKVKNVVGQLPPGYVIKLSGFASKYSNPCPPSYGVTNIRKQRGEFMKDKLVAAGVNGSKLVIDINTQPLSAQPNDPNSRRVTLTVGKE